MASAAEDKEEDFPLTRIILLGDKKVGKTALIKRYTEDSFLDSYVQTIGIDFDLRKIKLDNKSVKTQIWEMSGFSMCSSLDVLGLLRRFSSPVNSCLVGIMVVYDVNNKSSLESMEFYQETLCEIKRDKNIPMILVGNKCDEIQDRQDREVDDELVRKYKKLLDCDIVMDTSAKHGRNVEAAFVTLIAMYIKNAKNISGQIDEKKSTTSIGIRRQCYNSCCTQ